MPGESATDFCFKNKVPYNLFQKWYKDTRHHIVPVQVEGQEAEKGLSASVPFMGTVLPSPAVRFMIDIRMTGGMHIQMANVSAAYHTLISTCRANGISALAYLKRFFREVVKGRRDYENLLPMTIGINTNKF
ncbi:hypothetical protein ABHZ39_17410 [Bacteroides uniformis]